MTCADCKAEGADCLYAGYVRVCGDCLYDRVLADRDEHKAKREEYASEARSLRERLKDALRERDEARAEIERLKHDSSWGALKRLDDEWRVEAAAAFQRGAEAMREAAAREIERQVDALMLRAGLAADIRALPLPEDKP